MKKNLKSKFAGLLAGIMTISSLNGLLIIPASASERVEVNGFTLERDSETDGWKVVSFDGSTKKAVIPDAVASDGAITENPDKAIAGSVMYIDESVFNELSNVETLQLPKYLSGPEKGKTFENKLFNDLDNLTEFKSNNTGNGFYTYEGALYAGTELISYPQQKTGDYEIKDGTTSADEWAFSNANIGKLTLPTSFTVDNELDTDDNYYRYTFLSTSVDSFEGTNTKDGSIIENGRLVAYGNDATTDLSSITSANPYAFHDETVLKEALKSMPESVKTTVPFSFYSGEDLGAQYRTRYFNINGKVAYCYDYGKLNPETVGDKSDYNKDISDEETVHNVKAMLYAGYPNDAYGLIEKTGISEEAAKNVTGSLVWEYTNNSFNFDANEIYGDDDTNVIQDYYDQVKSKVSTSDEEMENFVLKFYNAKNANVQGLVVIEKEYKPDVPEKATVTISKQDITTKEELPGAQLTVTKDGTTIDTWTSSNEKHIIKDLEDGTYVLTEITAPNGYSVAESIQFVIENGVVKNGNEIIMYDAPETEIFISKQDITKKKELPGAKLELRKDNELIDSWVSSNEAHKIKNLSDGTYTLKEITAPDGYEVAEEITFVVKDGKTETNPIVMYDKPITTIPDKPHHNGSYSGGEKPSNETPTKEEVTIIETKEPTVTPEQTQEETKINDANKIERKPIKTGDILGSLEVAFVTLTILGGAMYIISKKRRND